MIKNKAKPVADRPVNEINIPLNKTIIDLEKFENLIIRLREIYAERQQNGQSDKVNIAISNTKLFSKK